MYIYRLCHRLWKFMDIGSNIEWRTIKMCINLSAQKHRIEKKSMRGKENQDFKTIWI